MDIEWKNIPEHEGYQASNTGRIRSFWKRNAGPYPVLIDDPSDLSQVKNKHGYYRVKIRGETQPVHKLILLAFSGQPKSGQICRHLDGDKSNNNIENLKWGSSQENSDDSLLHGTRLMRSKHYNARLSEDDVKAIRSSDRTDKELAEEYGVTFDHIYKIRTFEKWGDGHEIIRKGRPRKLTDEQVQEIRESDLRQIELGAKYGVSQTHISSIKLNKVRKGI